MRGLRRPAAPRLPAKHGSAGRCGGRRWHRPRRSRSQLPPEAVQQIRSGRGAHERRRCSRPRSANSGALADCLSDVFRTAAQSRHPAGEGRSLADAEKSLRAAVERNGNNAQAFNQLGIVYRKLGRFKEADVAYHARGADRSELRDRLFEPRRAVRPVPAAAAACAGSLRALSRRSPARPTRRSMAGSPS